MASSAGRVTLRGRFSPGSRVRLVQVDGAHVLRPPEGAESVDEQTVGEDGCVSFSKGVEVDARYFIVGQQAGEPLAVRARGRAADDPDTVLGGGGVPADRVRLADGSFVDEPPEQHQDQPVPEGATWLGQHQVPEGTWQRSDTPRGAAYPITAQELERAQRGWRKQEPTEPVVEASEDAGSAPARTAKPAAKSAATSKNKEA